MRIFKRAADYVKGDWDRGKEEIKHNSIIKNIAFFLIGVFCTCIFQMAVYKFHPSGYEGEKLKKYFISEICSELGYDSNNMYIENISSYESNILNNNRSFIIIGKYKTISDGKDCKSTIITIFEHKERTFWDFICNVDSKYEISYILESESIEGEYIFDYENIDMVDLDLDGMDEVIMDFKTLQATTHCRYTIILTNKDGEWCMIQPDFSNLQADVNLISQDYEVILAEMPLYDKLYDKKCAVYGISYGGALGFPVNRQYGMYNFFYIIPILKPNQGMLGIDTYAHIMLRLNGMDLVVDKSWNWGEIFIGEQLDLDETNEYYGVEMNGIRYYTLP